jgi:hypothetical protein
MQAVYPSPTRTPSNLTPRNLPLSHMDHPGWRLQPDKEFLGDLPERLLTTAPICEFGYFGMWDLPAFLLQGDSIHSRACDDLIGCAAIVATVRDLVVARAPASVYGVFTRAEEVGFIGAIQLAKSKQLPQDVTVVSLETSAELPPAKIGAGPIVRVGDRTSVFDPATTEYFVEIARSTNAETQPSSASFVAKKFPFGRQQAPLRCQLFSRPIMLHRGATFLFVLETADYGMGTRSISFRRIVERRNKC